RSWAGWATRPRPTCSATGGIRGCSGSARSPTRWPGTPSPRAWACPGPSDGPRRAPAPVRLGPARALPELAAARRVLRRAPARGRAVTGLPAWKLDRVDPGHMKVLALLLADPNPIHLDAAAAQRLGVADRPVNQGPSTMALAANMVLAAFPGARLTSLRT